MKLFEKYFGKFDLSDPIDGGIAIFGSVAIALVAIIGVPDILRMLNINHPDIALGIGSAIVGSIVLATFGLVAYSIKSAIKGEK